MSDSNFDEPARGGSGKDRAFVFSVDVEDWFQVSAFDRYVDRESWTSRESRVVSNTQRLLELLAAHGKRSGTFFVLGWVAERFPHLVREIVAAGHEIASHGYLHQRIPTIPAKDFRTDVVRAKAVLEQAAGVVVRGYRAPSFSMTDDVPWAPEILVESGYSYDSSRFPISRRGYGSGTAPRTPHAINTASGVLHEYPPAVWDLFGFRLPVAGGGWFRQFPLGVSTRGLWSVASEGIPAVFYIHPWEIDPAQPRLPVSAVTRIRHYRGLDQAAARLAVMCNRFAFQSFASMRLPGTVV